MSTYATADDVRLAANPDWRPGSPEPDAGSQDASSLTDEQLLDAIEQASSRIEGFIGARYQIPVAPVDPTANPVTYPDGQLNDLAVDIALFLATLTWLRHEPMEQTDPVWLRYREAMVVLTSIRDGKSVMNLPPAATGDAATSAGGYAGVVCAGSGGLFDAADAGFHRGWADTYPGGRYGW